MKNRWLPLRPGRFLGRLPSVLVAAAACLQGLAGPFRIDSPSVGTGGGRSAGPRFGMESTIGQAASDASKGTRFGLTAGIQAMIGTVPSPGLPQLRLVRDGQVLHLEWVSDGTPSILQFNPGLAGNGWLDAGIASGPAGQLNRVALGVVTGQRFYRLRR